MRTVPMFHNLIGVGGLTGGAVGGVAGLCRGIALGDGADAIALAPCGAVIGIIGGADRRAHGVLPANA
jgi:hypothetical protein